MTSPALVPLNTPANVVTGVAALFYQLHVPATPPVRPVDTVALGAAWPTPWIAVGATHEGVTLGFTRETTDITIEELSTPIDTRTASSAVNLSTVLAEDVLETLSLAFGGGTITSTAAGTGVWGSKDFIISDEMVQYSIGMEGRNKFGYPRRAIFPIVKSVSAIETAMRRTEKHMYAVTLRVLSPLSACVFHEITTPPTA